MYELSRKFRTPKKNDNKEWDKVEFLVKSGFYFYSVYEKRGNGGIYRVEYPKNLKQAKEFVKKYKDQKHSISRR